MANLSLRFYVLAGMVSSLLSGSAAVLAEEQRLAPAPSGSFSIVLIPDTQRYLTNEAGARADTGGNLTNPIFEAHTRWIAENLERHRIVFVSHVGDIVDRNDHDQWKVARGCMDTIHGKVPYGLSVGNHDMTSGGDSTLCQEYFPTSRYEDFDWYGGSFSGSPMRPQMSGNNANSYQLFSAGGMEWVFLHLECNAPDDVVAWANGVLEEHADRRAMITTHMGWGPRVKPKNNREYITGEKGRMQWSKIHGSRGNTPQQLWTKCYGKHRNLFAVFSGDQSRTQAIHAETPGLHGNPVHEFLQDYSVGWLRLYRFLPEKNRVEVITFDPRTEVLCSGTERVPGRGAHQFGVEYNMRVTSGTAH